MQMTKVLWSPGRSLVSTRVTRTVELLEYTGRAALSHQVSFGGSDLSSQLLRRLMQGNYKYWMELTARVLGFLLL